MSRLILFLAIVCGGLFAQTSVPAAPPEIVSVKKSGTRASTTPSPI